MAQQRRRRERGSISVDEILNGAFEVATDVSIDNLSMPLLARHLDVGVTSIYWYFRKKDELLDAMTDRALAQYEFTVPVSTQPIGGSRCATTRERCAGSFLTTRSSATCPHSRHYGRRARTVP